MNFERGIISVAMQKTLRIHNSPSHFGNIRPLAEPVYDEKFLGESHRRIL